LNGSALEGLSICDTSEDASLDDRTSNEANIDKNGEKL